MWKLKYKVRKRTQCKHINIWWGTTYIQEISTGGHDHCSIGFLCYVSVLGTHLFECACWHCCERLHFVSVNFFLRLFQCVCPFHDGWLSSVSAHQELSVQKFLTKKSKIRCTSLHIHPILSQATFFCAFSPRGKKSLKGTSCQLEKVKQRTVKALKRHQNWQVKKLFWAMENCFKLWKNVSIDILYQMETTLKVIEIETCKNRHTFL